MKDPNRRRRKGGAVLRCGDQRTIQRKPPAQEGEGKTPAKGRGGGCRRREEGGKMAVTSQRRGNAGGSGGVRNGEGRGGV